LNAFADGHLKGYSVTSETFKNMVGVGKIAQDAWDKIFTFGQAPVSDMFGVCQKIESLQQSTTGTVPLCECKA
jgi:hypothetical protein